MVSLTRKSFMLKIVLINAKIINKRMELNMTGLRLTSLEDLY